MENKLISKLKSHLKRMEEEDMNLRDETIMKNNGRNKVYGTQEARTV